MVLAYARYWSSVAPIVRREIRRWEARAAQIPDRGLQSLALAKLGDERFNVEVAAMVATTAPARHRRSTVEAIVAVQVIYDYLDALTEQQTANPIRDGLHQSKALIDAVTPSAIPALDYYAYAPGNGDAGYLADLVVAARDAVAALPAGRVIEEIIHSTADRCVEAQVRIHAVPQMGVRQLEHWAEQKAGDTELQWREWLFGAVGSVVAAHALIALAADERATRAQAGELHDTYISLCGLATLLDHLVDHDLDVFTGGQNYLDFYSSCDDINEQLTRMIRRVVDRGHSIPNGPHHVMILSGVVAYYTSQPSAKRDFARPVTIHVRDQVRPIITPVLATLHLWRFAKRLRTRSHTPRLSTTQSASAALGAVSPFQVTGEHGVGTEPSCAQSWAAGPESEIEPRMESLHEDIPEAGEAQPENKQPVGDEMTCSRRNGQVHYSLSRAPRESA